jgi:hypothetical protein
MDNSRIRSLFPSDDFSEGDPAGVTARWQSASHIEPAEVGESLSDTLGLSQQSLARSTLKSAVRCGVLTPKRTRDRNNSLMWRFLIAWDDRHFLTFHHPTMQTSLLACNHPPQYDVLVSEWGALRFGRLSGSILWPHEVVSLRNELKIEAYPFFDHATGDYDCWDEHDPTEVYTFDHERGILDLTSGGTFGMWFEARLLNYLK